MRPDAGRGLGEVRYDRSVSLVDFGEDAYERIEMGDLPTPGPIHIAARFQTAAPRHTWLNRIQAFGTGVNDAEGNLWDTYAIR